MVLFMENPSGFEKQSHAFGRDQSSLKGNDRRTEGCGSATGRDGALKTVRDDSDSRDVEKAGQPTCRRDVRGHASAKKAAHERRQPEFIRSKPALASSATQTFSMTPGHEMPRTDCASRFDEKLAVRAYGLKTMMFDNDRFPGKKGQNQRRKSRTSKVDHVGTADELPKLGEPRPADHTKGKAVIVKRARRGLGDNGNCKPSKAIRSTKLPEPAGKAEDNSFNASDTRQEEV